jgi:hypothetical protein
MIDDIQDDINNFKNDSLRYQNIQFKKENSNLFGELKVDLFLLLPITKFDWKMSNFFFSSYIISLNIVQEF